MLFGVLGGAGVFDQHKGKSQSGTLPRSGFDAYVGRNAGQDDRVDAAVLELLLQIGAGEGAPMTFGNEDVAGLKASRSSDLRRNGGQRFVAHVVRLIDRKLQEIVEIDTHIYNRGALGRESVRELHGIFNNLVGLMRRRGHAENGILQVDEDKCGLLGVELEFCHGFLFIEKIFEIEGSLDFPGIEYEDSLDFVKFDKGRPATGALFTQARQFPGCGGGTVCRGWL